MNVLFLTHPLNSLLMITMPIALGILITRRFRLSWGLFGIGAATFVLSQVGHIPFNAVLSEMFSDGRLPAPPENLRLVFFSCLWGLSAGVWEEGARYVAYRWFAKEARSWGRGLLLGAGHGGIEAILLGILVLVNFLYLAAMHGQDIIKLIPPDQATPALIAQAQAQVNYYWSMPWTISLLGAVERSFTIPFHLSCSLLVMQVFTRQQSRWLWLAIGWHALVDAVGPGLLAGLWRDQSWGVYAIEGVIGLFALASLGIIFALRQPEPEPEPILEQTPIQPLSIPLIETKPEDLDRTKYA